MNLKERISEDMKAAMKARQPERLSAIRLLLAAIKQREVDERKPMDDASVIAVIERLTKQRRDSIEQFSAAGRADLADKEAAELELLRSYLPQGLTDEQIDAEISAAIAATGAAGPQAMGKVMAVLKPKLAGRADMAQVSARIKARLAG
jgi:uncharacterized protein YqeY